MAAALGSDYRVIEAGLNGRTTVFNDPMRDDANGKAYLPTTLRTHMPLDLVILMLGTNDLKSRFSASVADIALGMGNLIEIVLNSRSGQAEKAPACLIVCPPPIAENFDSSEWAGQGIGALEKSKQLAPNYAKIAASLGVAFFDASTVIESSPVDSVHLSADAHATLGQALAQVVSGLPL
jgi:lysophospholipase L1-like esterase